MRHIAAPRTTADTRPQRHHEMPLAERPRQASWGRGRIGNGATAEPLIDRYAVKTYEALSTDKLTSRVKAELRDIARTFVPMSTDFRTWDLRLERGGHAGRVGHDPIYTTS
jgi:hypothetical protein